MQLNLRSLNMDFSEKIVFFLEICQFFIGIAAHSSRKMYHKHPQYFFEIILHKFRYLKRRRKILFAGIQQYPIIRNSQIILRFTKKTKTIISRALSSLKIFYKKKFKVFECTLR